MGKKVSWMKCKLKDPGLYRMIKNFLTSYLPVVKKKSPHTVRAYQDALNLYLSFLNEEYHISFREVTASDFSQTKET